MSGVVERAGAARAGRRAVAAAVDRLEQRVAAAVPGARVVREGDTLRVEGRGVIAALPWPGGLLR